MHGDEPVPQRQLAPVHHGAHLQALAVMAALALEALLVVFPIMLPASAVRADDSLCLMVFSQLAFAAFLIGKDLHKVNKFHVPLFYIGTKLPSGLDNF